MKTSLSLSLSLLLLVSAEAQDLRRVMPEPVPAPATADNAEPLLPDVAATQSEATAFVASIQAGEIDSVAVLPAQPGERVLIPVLNGVIFVNTREEARALPPAGFAGVDASRVSLLDDIDLAPAAEPFLGRPVSFESLYRLGLVMRMAIQMAQNPFSYVYVPPQDITSGIVRVVAAPALLEGDAQIEGLRWFSEKQYRAALNLTAGQPIDVDRVRNGIDALNRNPFRQVVVTAQAGERPGTSRLGLRVRESRPWNLSAGYENNGSASTGEDRVFGGFTWGNVLGLGHVATYRFTADPKVEHSESHSGSYSFALPWRHSVSLSGAWSHIQSVLPAPFTQEGTSWQASARYFLPTLRPVPGWERTLSFAVDFKYSDNNLEFARLPVTNNATHVLQASASYGLSWRGERSSTGVTATLVGSPGGITSRNHGRYFDVSRRGAKAAYAYAQLGAQHSRLLPRGLTWTLAATAQFTDAALLGSEQLNGGGSSAVRGYAESSAFGDWGIVANNELHLQPVALPKLRLQADPFAFVDYASLHTNVQDEDLDLISAGVGVNLAWTRNLTVRAACGVPLRDLVGYDSDPRLHVSATARW